MALFAANGKDASINTIRIIDGTHCGFGVQSGEAAKMPTYTKANVKKTNWTTTHPSPAG